MRISATVKLKSSHSYLNNQKFYTLQPLHKDSDKRKLIKKKKKNYLCVCT